MTREQKNLLIWLMFGLYFGMTIARVIKSPSEAGIIDWLLIASSLAVATLHYSPDKKPGKIKVKD